MSAFSIQPTFPIFTDIDGQPLEAGYVWIGQANLDPQVNPINVYWDAALTISAPQPIRTLAGYPSRNGTPGRLYVNSDYSIRVMNKNGSVVYSAPAATERFSGVVVSDVDAGSVSFDPFASYPAASAGLALQAIVNVKNAPFNAVGDGIEDDTAALQAAITYAFNNKIGTVFVPQGTYNISKPLYVWGSDNYIRSGIQLVGSGVDSTVIKKVSNTTPGDGSWYATIDAVVILSPYPAPGSGPSATGNYNPALIDMTIQGNSGTPNTYGIYTKDDFGQVKMERLCVLNTYTCFRTDGNMWLSSFRNISLHPLSNGFWMGKNGTSIDLTDVYVLGGSGVGFHLQALYSTANSIAVEGFTGTPVLIRFANWTINGLGIECAAATGPAVQVLNGSNVVLNTPLILAPNAFLCGDGCKMMVNGAQLGDEFAPAARTGYLWFVAGGGDLSIINLINYDTHAAANTGYAMVTDFSGLAPLTVNSLKIETPLDVTSLDIKSGSSSNTANAVVVKNSSGTQLFQVRNDGVFWTGLAAASPYNNTSAAAANIGVDSIGILFRSTSSLKYKENVQDAVHGLAEVLCLRPVTYQGKAEQDAGKTFGGLIAEEVHNVGLTEFVVYAEDGSPDALAYGQMVSLLVKAVQELSAQVDVLKNSTPVN